MLRRRRVDRERLMARAANVLGGAGGEFLVRFKRSSFEFSSTTLLFANYLATARGTFPSALARGQCADLVEDRGDRRANRIGVVAARAGLREDVLDGAIVIVAVAGVEFLPCDTRQRVHDRFVGAADQAARDHHGDRW